MNSTNKQKYYFYPLQEPLYFSIIQTILNLSTKNMPKAVDLRKDLLCGFASGNVTGWLFLIPEYIKVATEIKIGTPEVSIFKSLSDKAFRDRIIRGAITFPLLLGCVGAAEFACNDKIRDKYGKTLGIVASALTGALFLTPGDHFMLRQQKYGEGFKSAFQFMKNNRAFFIGYSGMFWREAMFMTNIIYIGPWTGQLMKKISGSKENEQISPLWKYIGRATSGVLSTFISHPFDVASKMQQSDFGENKGKVGLLQKILDLHLQHKTKKHQSLWKFIAEYPCLRGFEWRMWIGAFGGATIGGLYEYFTQQYDRHIY